MNSRAKGEEGDQIGCYNGTVIMQAKYDGSMNQAERGEGEEKCSDLR